jgi:eukaryotic-like serine/threonine-protein kinase
MPEEVSALPGEVQLKMPTQSILTPTPSRWSQMKDIFAAVVDQATSERQTAVAEACKGDIELQEELNKLLAQYDAMGGFLDTDSTTPVDGLLHPGYLIAERYRIVSLLGRGGMGEVYEADDSDLGGRIAIKVIHPRIALDPDALDRFRREVQLARQVTHPNVCRVFDIGHHWQEREEILFLTMELVRGETLSARLKRTGKIEPQEALSIARQLCQALEAAHRVSVLHRDLKCSNIMLAGEGEQVRAVITDFGIARGISKIEGSSATGDGQGLVVGTPAYMSPEQLQGKSLTLSSDIYSLGVVLYEMTTGVRPFHNDSQWIEAVNRLTDNPIEPVKISPGLGENWNKTILKCLERDPEKRIAPVEAVLVSLSGKRNLLSLLRKYRSVAALATTFALIVIPLAFLLWIRFSPAPLPENKHIAVFPFTFVGAYAPGPVSAYGLSESVTSNLARLEPANSSLWVVPWSQIRNMKPDDAAHAAASLGVNLLITGQMEKPGSGLRLRIEVKDAQTLRVLRSQVVTIPAEEMSTVEDSALERISAMLKIVMPEEILSHLPVDQKLEPDAYEFYQQGHGYLRHDSYDYVDRAIPLLQKAISLDARFAAANADLATAYVFKYRNTKDKHWLDSAKQFSSRALSLNDSLAPAHLAQAMILQESGDLESAISEYNRALRLDPADDEIIRRLALAYDVAGSVLKAESLIKDSIRRNPSDWVNYLSLGALYFHHAQYDQAEQCYRIVTELAPDNAPAIFSLGGVYLAQGKYNEAEHTLERAVAISPLAGAYSNLGTARFHLGNYASAAVAFLKAADLSPKDYVNWSNLADAYDMAGDHAKAEQAYERAVQELSQALTLLPNDGMLLERLALSYVKLGKKQDARLRLNQAMRHPADRPEFLFNAMRLYELTDQRDQALSTLRSVLRDNYSMSEIESDADLRNLRADPRYAIILKAFE